jgi:hypothetical protein
MESRSFYSCLQINRRNFTEKVHLKTDFHYLQRKEPNNLYLITVFSLVKADAWVIGEHLTPIVWTRGHLTP